MRVLVVLALLGAATAVPKRQQRIVGGSATTIDQYPYMSNMQYGYYGGTFWVHGCGGSLITSRHVLSAAQCYIGHLPSEWRVRLGSTFASSGGVIHYVSALIVHAEFNSLLVINDVAIVRLATAATLSNTIAVARIAGLNYNLPDGTELTAMGWGDTSPELGLAPEELHHTNIYQVNQQLCTQRYADLKEEHGSQYWPDVTDSMLCAGILDVGGKDACYGDSGGPVAHNGDIIVGIISWAFGCAHNHYPGVNTRVSTFSNWIVENASS